MGKTNTIPAEQTVESEVEGGQQGSRTQIPEGIRREPNKEHGRGGSVKAGNKKGVEDPWKKARGGPSEEWQPSSWSGDLAARR